METQQPTGQMPTNQPGSKSWILPVSIVLAAIIIIAGAWFIISQKSSNNQQANNTNPQQTPPLTTDQSTQTTQAVEFPWAQYPATVNQAANANQDVAGEVDVSPYRTVGLVIAQTYNAGAYSQTTKAYVFTALNLGVNAHIGTLYVESSTELNIGAGASVGQKIVMTQADLVTASQHEAGTSSATNQPTPTPNPPSHNPSPAPNPTPSPTSSSSGNPYTGSWNGNFTPSSLAAAAGCPGGGLTFTVSANGNMVGYIALSGGSYGGGGTVDSSGKIIGGWTFSGERINFSGQIFGKNGSGSYTDSQGCTGTFSVRQ
jgi:hypothetical protein